MTRARKDGGFSLVEILISVTLGLIILAAVTSVFVNSKQGYRAQESAGRLQENGRFAMDYLSRKIRMADHWGGLQAKQISSISDTSSYAGSGNCTGAWLLLGASGATSLSADAGIKGYQGAATNPAAFQTGCFASNPYINNSDVLVIRFANPDAFFANDCQLGLTACAPAQPLAGSEYGNFYLRVKANGALGELFNWNTDTAAAIAAIPDNASITNVGGTWDFQYSVIIFYLGTATYSSTNTTPTLYAMQTKNNSASFQPVADGVEMMKFEYKYINAGKLVAFGPASSITDWTQVIGVRVSLIVRGDALDNYTDAQQYQMTSGFRYCPTMATGCSASYAGFERYQRRLMVKEIELPNRYRNGAIS